MERRQGDSPILRVNVKMDSRKEIQSTDEFKALVDAQANEAAALASKPSSLGTWKERALAAESALWHLRENVMGQDYSYVSSSDICESCSDCAGDIDDLINDEATNDYPLDRLEEPAEATSKRRDDKPEIADRKIYAVYSRRTKDQPRLFVVARSEDTAQSVALAHEAWIDTEVDTRKRRSPVVCQVLNTTREYEPSCVEGIGIANIHNMLLSAALPYGEDQGVVVAVKAWPGSVLPARAPLPSPPSPPSSPF